MKLWIKVLLGALAGFGGGFAAGYFTHKKMNDVQFEEVSIEEMKEIEEAASNKEKRAEMPSDDGSVVSGTVNGIREEDIASAAGNPEEMRRVLQGKTPYIRADEEQKKAYEKMWKATREYSNEENANNIPTMRNELPHDEAEDEHPIEEDFDPEFMEIIEEEAAEAGSGFVAPPHAISLAEFYNERPEYDKITIDWFEPDNTWLDEREEVIADIRSYIGLNVLDLFEKNGPEDDPDIRFIRNEKYGTDYEIIRHHRSWRETTGG